MRIIKESDLYKPIYDYLTTRGYEVKSEVLNCDITAIKDDELIVIEMKKTLNIKLLVQGAKRLTITDLVYIALPKPDNLFKKRREWNDKYYLLRRLELGLIFVSFKKDKPEVEIKFHPQSFDTKKSRTMSKRKKNNLIREMEGRYGDYNTGGSTGKKLVTSYREKAIHIACCLSKYGELSPKKLRELGTGEKTLSILSKNFYNWFQRVSRGVYKLSEQGEKDLKEYRELVNHYYEIIKKNECKD